MQFDWDATTMRLELIMIPRVCPMWELPNPRIVVNAKRRVARNERSSTIQQMIAFFQNLKEANKFYLHANKTIDT